MTRREAIAGTLLVGLFAWSGAPPAVSMAAQGISAHVGAASSGMQKAKGGAKAKAKKTFKKAMKLYNKGQFAEALEGFESAYEASAATKYRYFIGMCLFELGHWFEAESELEGYLEGGAKKVDKKKRAAALDALEQIQTHIATVTIECDVEGASLTVDGVDYEHWEIRLVEGDHELVVSAAGFDTITRELELEGGQSETVRFEFNETYEDEDETAETPAGKVHVGWFAATAALTGALVLTAVITGSVALGRQSKYESMSYEDDWSSYRQATLDLGIATDVLWGLAGAAAVTSVILAIFTDFATAKEKKALSVAPMVGGLQLGLKGEF